MFWLSVLNIPIRFANVTLLYLAFMTIGAILAWRGRARYTALRFWPTHWARRIPLLLILALALAQLFNAGFWPFYRDDVLGIYAPYAARIYENGALVSLRDVEDIANRYDSYPMMIPLLYAYTYFSAGWQQEYLAKTLSTMLALMNLLAVYLLGKSTHSSRAGWLSVVLLALTPTFWHWASSGYVDLPMAYFYTMTAYFALRLWRKGRLSDAILAGFHLGLATWAKNAGLVGVPLLFLWLLLGWRRGVLDWRHLPITGLATFVGGLGWYVWTLLHAGLVVPQTAWTEQAQHTLSALLILITQPQSYAFNGWFIMIGLGYTAWRAWQSRFKVPEQLLLLLWVIPFWLVWWWFTSYDPRFVLLFLPAASVFGGILLTDGWQYVPAQLKSPLRVLTLITMLIWGAYGIFISVQFKRELIPDPWMSHEEKEAIVRPNSR